MTNTFVQSVSRRLCNASYILWVLAHALLAFLLMLLVQLFTIAAPQSIICTAINRNMLFVFLIANVMTGAVNMMMRTLDVSESASVAVVTGYAVVVCAVAVVLHLAEITVKFW